MPRRNPRPKRERVYSDRSYSSDSKPSMRREYGMSPSKTRSGSLGKVTGEHEVPFDVFETFNPASSGSKKLKTRSHIGTPGNSLLVKVLNDQGVDSFEKEQYAEAKESFDRALRIIEQDILLSFVLEEGPVGDSTPFSQNAHSDSWFGAGPITSALLDDSKVVDTSAPGLNPDCRFKYRNEYDEGITVSGGVLRVDDTTGNRKGVVLYNIGRLYHEQEEYESAILWYRRSLCALETERLCDDKNIFVVLAGLGEIQYFRGDHRDALRTFTVALSTARIAFGLDSIEAAACMNCIGVLNYVLPDGDLQLALDMLGTSQRIRRVALGEDHVDVGVTWNNMGRVYFKQGKFKASMSSYTKALCIRKRVLGDGVDVAATLFNMGQVFHMEGNLKQAAIHYKQFLKIAKVHFGRHHRDIAIVTTCMGQLYHEKKSYKKAMAAFQQALCVGRKALGHFHPEIAITLNKLGNLYYEMGDLDSALEAYKKGLEVEKVVHREGDSNVIVTMTNIAEIYKQQKVFDQAIEFYMQVLNLQRKHLGDSHLDVATTLSSIGYVRHQQGDYAGALSVSQECLRLRREAKGDVDEDVAITLTHIALILIRTNMHDVALDVLTEAYRIRSTLKKSNFRDMAVNLYNIAMIHHHQGSYELALAFYHETARVEMTALGEAHRDLAITFYNIGQIHYQCGDMNLALENFRRALDIERNCFGDDHPTCARTLNEIGNIELQRGNLSGLMTSYTEALRIYRRAGMGDNHLVVYGSNIFRLEVVHPEAAAAA